MAQDGAVPFRTESAEWGCQSRSQDVCGQGFPSVAGQVRADAEGLRDVRDVVAIFHGMKADLVSCTVDNTSPDSAPAHPHGETVRMMCRDRRIVSAPGVRPNSRGPDNDVSSSRPRCLRSFRSPAIGLSTAWQRVVWIAFELTVSIPAIIINLYEPDAAFTSRRAARLNLPCVPWPDCRAHKGSESPAFRR